MSRIKAAVCHEFGKPLHVEDIDLRAPENEEIEVTLGADWKKVLMGTHRMIITELQLH